MKKIISKDLVEHIAKLAKIPISKTEKESLAEGFNKTLEVVDEKKMFSQEEALKNTKNKHNGYFVVDQILPND